MLLSTYLPDMDMHSIFIVYHLVKLQEPYIFSDRFWILMPTYVGNILCPNNQVTHRTRSNAFCHPIDCGTTLQQFIWINIGWLPIRIYGQMAVNFVAKYVHAEVPVPSNPNVECIENFQAAVDSNIYRGVWPPLQIQNVSKSSKFSSECMSHCPIWFQGVLLSALSFPPTLGRITPSYWYSPSLAWST